MNRVDISLVLKEYTSEESKEILKFIDWLIENHYAQYLQSIEEWESFVNLDSQFHSYYKVSNAIIDVDFNKEEILGRIINEIVNAEIPYLEFRIQNLKSISQIEKLLHEFHLKNILELNLIILNKSTFALEELERLCNKFLRIKSIVCFGSINSIEKYLHDGQTRILYSTKVFHGNISCGEISDRFFSVNVRTYTEGLKKNSCLNSKISINSDGDLKNCPSMVKSFGNILNDNILSTITKHSFKKLWNIKKDNVKVCKDCELRYACTDCRAYLEDPEDIYSKPLKCGYDPYTGEWSEWSTNPLKQKAIKYYGMEDLVKKNV
jgi:SPASM domain peptide maturase of grasp-with-spasm system